jgi:hypothetical protein
VTNNQMSFTLLACLSLILLAYRSSLLFTVEFDALSDTN